MISLPGVVPIAVAAGCLLTALLGRLAVELGADVFQARVRLVRTPEAVREMANVVVRQRMDRAEPRAAEGSPE